MTGYINKSKTNNWGTPPQLMKKYETFFDPCPYPRADWDALTLDWSSINKKVYVNPPYSEIKLWAKKCREEQLKGCEIHLLIPARTDTKYFHKWILPFAEIEFIKGRLKFINLDDAAIKTSAPFASIICKYKS